MDSDSIPMILVVSLLILASAYFSATETAFSSLNKIRLKNLVSSGSKKAKLALELSENYDKILSTILIGNNIVNIVSASIATIIFTNYFHQNGILVSTIVMTILVLIFGEISPKSLAKESPEQFAMWSAPLLKVLVVILSPINYIFSLWQKIIFKFLKTDGEKSITEDELITMVEEAEQDGELNEDESELIRSAIEFNDLEVTDVLTPRIDVVAISKDEEKAKISLIFLENGFSRLPVYDKNVDNIIGFVNQKDFHNYILNSSEPLSSIIKPIVFTAHTMKISKLLKLLQQTKSHIAVVTDEYGGTMGIVTLEDIIEELVGEIWDEHEEVINDFEEIAPNKFKVSCNANLDKMFKLFGLNEDTDITSVSGWVIEQLGKIPNIGDKFSYKNLAVSVFKTDHKRVLEIIVILSETGQKEE